MGLSILDVDKFCENLPEVTSHKIYEKKSLNSSGLFSQTIFGPIKSYQCACRIYSYSPDPEKPKVCPKCGVEYTTSEKRKKTFAKIVLPFEVLNPIFFNIISEDSKDLKKIVTNMIYYRERYFFDENNKIVKFTSSEQKYDKLYWGAKRAKEFILELYKRQDENNIKKTRVRKFIQDNIDKFLIKNIIVIPPDFRPMSKIDDTIVMDEINLIYQKILKISEEYKNISYNVYEEEDIYKNNFRYVQKLVFDIFDYCAERINKKIGLIRNNILGKRVDFSGRAVIAPDPELNIDECKVPYEIALELLKPKLIPYLINKNICKRYNDAISKLDDSIRKNDFKFMDILKEYIEKNEEVVILNRQPTLHRLSVLAFKIVPYEGKTIGLHPMICDPFNADFDGDAMAIYLPITDRSKKDVLSKIAIWNNLISPTNLNCVPKANQDIVLGTYLFSKKELENFIDSKYLNKIEKQHIGGKELTSILNDIVLNEKPFYVMKIIDDIKKNSLEKSTMEGFTLSLDDFEVDEEIKEFKKEFENLDGKDKKQMKNFITKQKSLDKKLKKRNTSYALFIESGARGSWDQAKQIFVCRGFVADIYNNVIPIFLKNSYMDGLTKKEFFASCFGTRKGLVDTAVSTGDSGYLTRQLIYSSSHISLSETAVDCGTKDTLEVTVEDEKFLNSILGRVYIDENGEKKIVKKDDVELIGKTINMRSPIFCKSEKICKTCYGNLSNLIHSNDIGIIATQAVGERTTQLVLRTFHVSGVVRESKETGENEDIISGISILRKLLHSPKNILGENLNYKNLLMALYKLFSEYGKINLVHYEVILASMMWKGRIPWRLSNPRSEEEIEYVSVLKVPSRSSWLLACSFSDFKKKIIKNLLFPTRGISSSLDDIILFKNCENNKEEIN